MNDKINTKPITYEDWLDLGHVIIPTDQKKARVSWKKDDFIVGRALGKGKYGMVYLAKQRQRPSNTSFVTNTDNTNRLINGSANVTSVLRNAEGDYTITFTTAIPNNFAMTGSVWSGNTDGARGISGVMFATADTTAINRANELNAQNLLGISNQAYNNLWQYYGDTMEWAWKSSENERERVKDLTAAQINASAATDAAKIKGDYESSSSIGGVVLPILFKKFLGIG